VPADSEKSGEASARRLAVPDDELGECTKFTNFGLQKLLHNNLANLGPDPGAEGMIYEAFEPKYKEYLNVHINALSSYSPFSAAMNGWSGPFASINVNAGTQVVLRFSFWSSGEDSKPVTFSKIGVTFVDLDQYEGGGCEEFISAGGFSLVVTEPTTELVKVDDIDGKTRFHSSTKGDGTDNPTITEHMTQRQKDRSVMFFYRDVHEFNITIGAGAGRVPRFFMFVGQPLLLCAKTSDLSATPLDDVHEQLPALAVCAQCTPVAEPVSPSTFEEWYVAEGAHVKIGDPIALTRHVADGRLDILTSPKTGQVMALQSLEKGGSLGRSPDHMVAVVSHVAPLAPLSYDEAIGTAVASKPFSIFINWEVEVGD
jgi:hypothetical protein